MELALAAALTLTPAAPQEVALWTDAGFTPAQVSAIESQRGVLLQLHLARATPAVSVDLKPVQALYLAQSWDAMIDAARALELEVTARASPLLCDELWDVEFQLALGLCARAAPGDRALADERARLAHRLQTQRRPAAGMYGPDVAQAFEQAIAHTSDRTSSSLAVTPSDAMVRVDCQPLSAASLELPEGLHLLELAAPGFASEAMVIDTRLTDHVRHQLAPDNQAGLGQALAVGSLRLGQPSSQAVLRRAASTQAGPVLVVVRQAERFESQLVTETQVSPIHSETDPVLVATITLEHLGLDGRIYTHPPRSGVVELMAGDVRVRPRVRSRVRSWIIGLSVGLIAATALAVGLGVGLSRPDPPASLDVTILPP